MSAPHEVWAIGRGNQAAYLLWNEKKDILSGDIREVRYLRADLECGECGKFDYCTSRLGASIGSCACMAFVPKEEEEK